MKVLTERVTERELADARWVSGTALHAGRAVKYVSEEYPSGYRAIDTDDVKGRLLTEDSPVTGPTVLTPETVCSVNGTPVVELAVLIKPVAFLVTVEHGVHELTRCYYQGGRFLFGVDLQRLGAISAVRVDYDTHEGLRIQFSYGYHLFIPSAHCQATWRYKAEAE